MERNVANYFKPIIMTIITKNQLLDLLSNLPAGTFISFLMATSARLLVKASKEAGIVDPKGAVKLTRLSAQIGVVYQNKVNNQLERENKENDFVAKKAFYDFESKNRVVAKGKKNPTQKYLVFTPFANSYPMSKYLIDNKIVSKSNIPTDALPKTYNPQNQGTDTPIIWRTVKIENIRTVAMNGQNYKVV
jgi:hypothetical protein